MFTPAEVTRGFGTLARYLWTSSRGRVLPLLDRASTRWQLELPLLEAALTRIEPTLSLHAVRAEVVRIVLDYVQTRIGRPLKSLVMLPITG